MELRCTAGNLHGKIAKGVIEIKCKNRLCGAGPGVVVIHKFDQMTGILVETVRYKSARKERS